MKKLLKVGLLVVLAVGLAAAGTHAWAANPKVIKVGYIAPFTGAAAEMGTNGIRGVELAVEDINKKGVTIGGEAHKIEIVRYDDVCTPVEGVADIRKMIMQDKVVAYVGPHCSSVCIAVAEVAEQAKIPGITIECAADKVTSPGFDYFFRMRPSMGLMAPLAIPEIVNKMQPKSVAFLVINDDYGKSFADSFKAEFAKAGIKTVAEETFERGNTDMMVYLTKIKAAKPDVCFYVGTTPEGAMILKQAKEIGLTKDVNLIGSEEMGEMELVALAGAEAAEGTYGVALWGSVPVELEKRVAERYKAPMHYALIFAYDAMMVMADAIERAQSLDGTKIRDALKATDYKGYEGQIKFETFDDFKNQGRYTPVIMMWKDGKRSVLQ